MRWAAPEFAQRIAHHRAEPDGQHGVADLVPDALGEDVRDGRHGDALPFEPMTHPWTRCLSMDMTST